MGPELLSFFMWIGQGVVASNRRAGLNAIEAA